ncbi:MspA family porin [Nocardia vinacea]|uniref:MspA family porin n=1 Tax=Nocardia vinacea TaxID=96468 RepID=UPI0002E718DF|nr:MspA family porin [Nocardia vinacea]
MFLRGAGAAAALTLCFAAVAGADTVIALPGGEITKTLSDGTVVTVRLVGESAEINPSMGSTPAHHNAWVSGSAQVDLSGPGGSAGGIVFPGYTVGCQVDIAGGGANGGVEGGLRSDGQYVTPQVGATSGANLTLGPGQAKSFYLLDREKADDFGNESHKMYNRFSGTSGSVTWTDETLGLSGCGGYAQARAFVSVEVRSNTVSSWITLWGKPFSLG